MSIWCHICNRAQSAAPGPLLCPACGSEAVEFWEGDIHPFRPYLVPRPAPYRVFSSALSLSAFAPMLFAFPEQHESALNYLAGLTTKDVAGCGVCFEDGEGVALACGHEFHRACV
jgi:hypothetical protein